MGFIFDQGNVNTAALTVPGAYVQLMTPSGLSLLTPSNAIAIAGTGSWGPVNVVQGPFGDIGSAAAVYGQFDATKFLSDPYDIMRAVMQSMGEAQTTLSLNVYTNRISDGTEAAATRTFVDVTPTTPLTGIILPAKWTGVGGNTITCTISAGSVANAFNVTFVASLGGQAVSEVYTNIQGSASGASPFWVNLKNALLNGTQFRAPSQLIGTPSSVSVIALNPAVGSFLLAGGTDGRSTCTSASFFGSDVIGNRQGIYAFRSLPIVPAYLYCAGLTDTTKFANLQSFCLQEVMRTVVPFVSGTSTTSAVTSRGTLGISDKRFCYAKDWIYWSDPISGLTLFTDPVAIMIGRAASLSPHLSPLNKQVYSVVGSEHPQQYPADEIGLLNTNGIWVIANPCLSSPYWGIASASTTSINPIEQPVEYERLKDYIGIQFARILAQFVGLPQSVYDPDDTRSKCKSAIDSAMRTMLDNSLIVDWESQCDAKLNNPGSVQAGYMKGALNYIPYNTVKFVLLNVATANHLSAGQAFALSSSTP